MPTRELATQVADEVHKLAAFRKGLRSVPIYGGAAYERQFAELKRGAHIVVGTPGRLTDHLARGTLDLAGVRMLILDEADVVGPRGHPRPRLEEVLDPHVAVPPHDAGRDLVAEREHQHGADEPVLDERQDEQAAAEGERAAGIPHSVRPCPPLQAISASAWMPRRARPGGIQPLAARCAPAKKEASSSRFMARTKALRFSTLSKGARLRLKSR